MSTIFERLSSAQQQGDTHLVEELKELKNSVIGNVLRKVQVAEDGDVLRLLIGKLNYASNEMLHLQVINEVAVILGSLANAEHLTLPPLLLAHLPARLMELVASLSLASAPPRQASYIQTKVLPSLLRALRNVLTASADAVWGHMWGVGVERKVVATGLVGYGSVPAKASKGKGKESSAEWRPEAKSVLGLIFESHNLDALLGLLSMDEDRRANPQILLPLFELLSHLVVLPSHRKKVAAWSRASSAPVSSLLNHLLLTISQPSSGLRSSAAAGNKLQVAALNLLASLVKDETAVAEVVKQWRGIDGEPFMEALWTLVRGKEAGVRVSAAACLTNILRGPTLAMSTPAQQQLHVDLVKLMPSLLIEAAVEDRIRACFVLSHLIQNQIYLQEIAADVQCPHILISRVTSLAKGTEDEEISEELRARYMESLLLALAALSFNHEPSRALIANAQPSLLDIMLGLLSHESYGVRAATCQLARALSRSVAILRTNLMDSGVGAGIFDVLKRETERKVELDRDDRSWTVEVAATATICNLVTDFSPMQRTLIDTGGIELLAGLTKSPHEPLQLNALWALKNMTYHAPDEVKAKVMEALGWSELAEMLDVDMPLPVREQAIDIVRNLVADAGSSEIGRVAECLGFDHLLHCLEVAMESRASQSLQAPALWVLSNLALGPEKLRSAMTTRLPLVEGLSNALNEKSDSVKAPALMCLRHLIEINVKTNRPRPSVVALFQPYQLGPRLHELATHSTSLDVAQGAHALLGLIRNCT